MLFYSTAASKESNDKSQYSDAYDHKGWGVDLSWIGEELKVLTEVSLYEGTNHNKGDPKQLKNITNTYIIIMNGMTGYIISS